MSGELQQRWVETDGIPSALQYRTLQVVVEQNSGDTAKGAEGAFMAPQEIAHLGIEEKRQIDSA